RVGALGRREAAHGEDGAIPGARLAPRQELLDLHHRVLEDRAAHDAGARARLAREGLTAVGLHHPALQPVDEHEAVEPRREPAGQGGGGGGGWGGGGGLRGARTWGRGGRWPIARRTRSTMSRASGPFSKIICGCSAAMLGEDRWASITSAPASAAQRAHSA